MKNYPIEILKDQKAALEFLQGTQKTAWGEAEIKIKLSQVKEALADLREAEEERKIVMNLNCPGRAGLYGQDGRIRYKPPHFDSTGKKIKVGDRVRFRGQEYTIKRFLKTTGTLGTPQIEFEEERHTPEIPDEIGVDLIKEAPDEKEN